ncbi:dTDP-4-dehydrorhamnose reductase [Desulfotalea psychrophila]|uniref:dTDP-4-dehydrorhamnose reductase n=1 Tax=Desulfotalea psychrophila (strain LSv54 / DSM 12343) TaxID=177439 RepID=Q6AL24_DESPS|nr:dTDP-4-dehydrorhamnose reductase [Desulfotalea psychrophila]CAG36951.1 probable dTDP-4-rhamnose reductase [Desulfotalea psychrophila LSv54]
MRILVTGSGGQVGKCLCRQLSGKVELLTTNRSELDITCQKAVLKTVTGFQPDIIINATGYTAVDLAEENSEEAYRVNQDGAKFLGQAATAVGAALLHISTDYVFSGEKSRDESYSEGEEPGPLGVYGKSKLAGEKAVANTCKRHIILRTSWVFSEYGRNFVKTMIALGQKHDSLSIVSDQYGGPTYAGDIASALITIAEKISDENFCQWGLYHFAGQPFMNWSGFAKVIFSEAERENLLPAEPVINNVSSEQYPSLAKRPGNSQLDTSKLTAQFGISPSDWQQALREIIKFFASKKQI